MLHACWHIKHKALCAHLHAHLDSIFNPDNSQKTSKHEASCDLAGRTPGLPSCARFQKNMGLLLCICFQHWGGREQWEGSQDLRSISGRYVRCTPSPRTPYGLSLRPRQTPINKSFFDHGQEDGRRLCTFEFCTLLCVFHCHDPCTNSRPGRCNK